MIRKKTNALTLALVLVCLTSCVSLPSPDLGVELPQNWRNGPELPLAGRETGSWWQALNDPQLDILVEQALQSGFTVRAAQARLQAARTLYKHSRDEYLPSLRARTFDAIDPDASASFIVAGFDASWELGLFGRSQGVHQVAGGIVAGSEAELRDVQVSLAGEVARDWIMLRSAQRRELLQSQICQARERQAQLVAKRVELKLSAPQQLAAAQAASADAHAALSAPRQEVIAAAQALAALLGRVEPDPKWLQSGPVPLLGEWKMIATPADVLRVRPDIARSQADVLRAAGELNIAHAERFPNIGIGGTIQWSTNVSANRSTHSDEAIAAFGPAIDIPLFDWGIRKAHESAKSDELLALSFAYRKTVFDAVADVETSLGALEQQRLREHDSLVSWQARGSAADAVTTRRKLGLSSDIDTLDSAIERDQAELALIEARASHALAYVALNKALGGGQENSISNNASKP